MLVTQKIMLEHQPGVRALVRYHVEGAITPMQAAFANDGTTRIPFQYERLGFDGSLYAGVPQVRRLSAARHYEVIVEYGPPEPGVDPAQPDDLTCEIRPIVISVPRAFDADVNPLLNSAADPFDPPPSDDVTNWRVTFRRTLASWVTNSGQVPAYDRSILDSFQKKVNAAPVQFMGKLYDARKIRCDSIYPDGAIGLDQDEIRLIYEFEIGDDVGEFVQLDEGRRAWGGTASTLTLKIANITDEYGNNVGEPVKLDGTGKPMDKTSHKLAGGASFANAPFPPTGMTTKALAGGNGVLAIYQRCKSTDFAVLNVFEPFSGPRISSGKSKFRVI